MAILLFSLTEYALSFKKNVWIHIAYVFYKFSELPCECFLNFFPLPLSVYPRMERKEGRGKICLIRRQPFKSKYISLMDGNK
jgi:hypothetical protein